MAVLFTDIEVYKNFHYVGFKREKDGHRVGFELSERSPDYDWRRVSKILAANQIVTYNGLVYDLPMLYYAFALLKKGNLSVDRILRAMKSKSDAIIQSGVRHWEVEKLLGIRMPLIDHIDLKDVQPNGQTTKPGEAGGTIFTSLKTLNGRLHGHRLQDLPYPHDAELTPEQMDATADYCLTSDLDATHNLFDALREPLELRVALGKEYGMDFRSKSDSQIGEAIVKKEVETMTGARPVKSETKPGTTFHYPVPAFMKFETPALQAILEGIRETEFVVNAKGKVELPKWLSETPITIGGMTYTIGIGGLHSTEKTRAVHSDDDYILVDADVASQYPSIILLLGLFPKSLGEHFLKVYRKLRDQRIAAKRAGNKVMDKGMKISLNGVYGKLGSRYSIVYAPHLLASVTLTGQLTLLMLIERAEQSGVQVLSGNTDGVLFRCPRSMYRGVGAEGEMKDRLMPSALADICAEWEATTTFALEFAEYKSVYSRDVNNYVAIKANGGHKRIGAFCNPWNPDKSDRDERKMLMKNPTAVICTDAALALIKDGTPIEETIYGCGDMRKFVTVIKADGGATWRDQYLGKTVRYYWATDGDPLFKVKAHKTTGNRPQVPKTEGAAPCMTLPDELPDDIDYARYIAETREMLMSIGYTARPPEPPKLARLTKANTQPILHLWAMVGL